MVVQHNLRAMNSNRMLGITSGVLSKSAEKLSSGYKVNRAADDAAGLSISEKMRKQIRGLTQASANAEDGISSVQTAEGALTEVHDMLQRMNELANKASNGTNSVSDRQTIQDEVDQLLTEIDRVSETTKFNEIYLLKGNAAGNESVKSVNAHDAGIKGSLVDKGGKTATFSLDKALKNGDEITIAGEKYTIGNKAVSTDTKFAVYSAAAATTGAKTLQAGDTITYSPATSGTAGAAGAKYNALVSDYKTATMAAKVKNEAALFVTANNGTTVVIEDGAGAQKTYVFDDTANSAVGTDGKETKKTAAEMVNTIADAFSKGQKVTMTKFGTNDVNWEVAEKLENGEVGGDKWFGADVNTMMTTVGKIEATALAASGKAGDAIRAASLGGVETQFTNTMPISADKFATAVSMLQSGDKMSIQSTYRATPTADAFGTAGNTTDITIADETDAKANKYTTADALKLVNQLDGDLDQVKIHLVASGAAGTEPTNAKAKSYLKSLGITVNTSAADASLGGKIVASTTAFSVTSSPTKGDAASNVITASDAYNKIADALKQASSIGTDEGKGASVKNNGNGTFSITKGSATVKDALSFNLHVGADADMTNKINVKLDTIDTKGLGIQNLDVIGKDAKGEKIDDGGAAATYAIDSISDAIAKVSAQRSLLGAVQNRLDHTINNLGNVVENTTAAESQIRDTDMATEMVKFANSNILAQAGQSMLAQANQANQGVLSLLG